MPSGAIDAREFGACVGHEKAQRADERKPRRLMNPALECCAGERRAYGSANVALSMAAAIPITEEGLKRTHSQNKNTPRRLRGVTFYTRLRLV